MQIKQYNAFDSDHKRTILKRNKEKEKKNSSFLIGNAYESKLNKHHIVCLTITIIIYHAKFQLKLMARL